MSRTAEAVRDPSLLAWVRARKVSMIRTAEAVRDSYPYNLLFPFCKFARFAGRLDRTGTDRLMNSARREKSRHFIELTLCRMIRAQGRLLAHDSRARPWAPDRI